MVRLGLRFMVVVIVFLITVIAAWAPFVRANPDAELQQDECLTNKQALELAQKTTGTTSTYKLTGNVGPTGTKIVAYALERIGCVIVESGRDYQYLLVDSGGNPALLGQQVRFEKNDKFVKVNEEFQWEPDVIRDVELLTPKPAVIWTPEYVTVTVSNLADTHPVRLESSQPRPWEFIFTRTLNFDISADQSVSQKYECVGVYLPGTWKLFLSEELIGEGVIERQECKSSKPLIWAITPRTIFRGRNITIHGAGYGDTPGRIDMLSPDFSRNPRIVTWNNWEITANISVLTEVGEWDIVVLRPYQDGHTWSNILKIPVHELYQLFFPRLERRQNNWR